MVAWEEYKAEARARGALAQEFFVVQSVPVAPPEKIKAMLPDHLVYQHSLEEAGSLVFAGPLSDESGKEMQSMGMIVYRAESLDAARALAEGDPMHSSGARSFTLRKWLINEGSFSVSVRLSAPSISLRWN